MAIAGVESIRKLRMVKSHFSYTYIVVATWDVQGMIYNILDAGSHAI